MTAYLLQLPHRADMTDSLRARFRDLTVDRPADAHHATPVGHGSGVLVLRARRLR